MTATVKEFCRINGLDEKSENLVELIFTALTGGGTNERTGRITDTGKEIETAIPDGTAGEADP